MSKSECEKIRSQIMFYIDNELPSDIKNSIVGHIDKCFNCKQYLDNEQQIKYKICKKLKDAYICKCDVENLKNSIITKIRSFTK